MLKLLNANSVDLDGWVIGVEVFKVLCHHPDMNLSKSPDIQSLLDYLEKPENAEQVAEPRPEKRGTKLEAK